MPMTARANASGPKLRLASGNRGRQKRRKPYVPIFRRTPARITLPGVGASTWASGNHVWKGKSGTLMAKARAKARNMRFWRETRGHDPAHQHGQIERVHAGGAAVLDVEGEDGHEHEQRAHQGVEHELDGRVDPVAPAPHPDDEVHGDEHRLPEHVEQEDVEADEDAQHARLEDEHGDDELLHAVLDGVPGGGQGDRGEKRGQQHEEEADPVDAQVVAHAQRRDPARLLDELVVGLLAVEAEVEGERQGQGDQRHDQAHRPDAVRRAPRREGENDRAQQGQERDRGEEPDPHRRARKKPTRSTAPTSMVSA